MTTFTPDFQNPAATANDAAAARRRRHAQRSPFTEVLEARRQQTLQVAAVSTGILTVTVAASAAIILGLSA